LLKGFAAFAEKSGDRFIKCKVFDLI